MVVLILILFSTVLGLTLFYIIKKIFVKNEQSRFKKSVKYILLSVSIIFLLPICYIFIAIPASMIYVFFRDILIPLFTK